MTRALDNKAGYRTALREASTLFEDDPEVDPRSPEGQRFNSLISDIEAYEKHHFGDICPITTPEGEVVGLSAAVFAGMLPGELFFAPRDSEQWRKWRAYHVEHLPRAAQILSAAARQRLFVRQPGTWKEVVTIVHDALRVADARALAGGSEEIASVLETIRAMREVGALSKSEVVAFEDSAGVKGAPS